MKLFVFHFQVNELLHSKFSPQSNYHNSTKRWRIHYFADLLWSFSLWRNFHLRDRLSENFRYGGNFTRANEIVFVEEISLEVSIRRRRKAMKMRMLMSTNKVAQLLVVVCGLLVLCFGGSSLANPPPTTPECRFAFQYVSRVKRRVFVWMRERRKEFHFA